MDPDRDPREIASRMLPAHTPTSVLAHVGHLRVRGAHDFVRIDHNGVGVLAAVARRPVVIEQSAVDDLGSGSISPSGGIAPSSNCEKSATISSSVTSLSFALLVPSRSLTCQGRVDPTPGVTTSL